MQENFEDQNVPGLDFEYCLGVARRRYLHFVLPFFVGWLAVWLSSWVLPARYKSSTLILVERPTMPRDYVTPNITDDLQGRLQSITQQILSRTRLLHIIDDLNLYASGHGPLTPDDKVDRMRKDIEIQLVRDNQNEISAFNVYYSARDPRIAQQVTSELTNLFIDENLEVRQQESEGTTKFLENQLETARQTLTAQEQKVREFKAQHVGDLPTQLGTNLQILNGLQNQLQAEQGALNTAKQQRIYLQTLLDQYRAMEASARSDGAVPVGLPALDQELDRLKAQLADLSVRYTDQHPDVRKLKDQIARTENMRSLLLADLKAKRQAAQPDTDTNTRVRDLADLRNASPIVQVEGQLQANQAEITNRDRAIEELKVKIVDYQNRLNQEPIREQQLADLTRGYEQSKQNYDDLLKKRNESAMATSMELLQQGERFRILDPPSLPIKPDSPNRLKFCAAGLGIGMVLGLIVAGAFELLDDRMYEEKQLKLLLPVPVVSEIPDITSPAEEQQNRKKLWLGWATAGLVLAVILVGSALSYLRG